MFYKGRALLDSMLGELRALGMGLLGEFGVSSVYESGVVVIWRHQFLLYRIDRRCGTTTCVSAGKAGSELLYAGCSAGGLTSASHVDYVASLFPDAKVLGMTDAMFSIMRPNYQGNYSYLNNMMDFGFTVRLEL